MIPFKIKNLFCSYRNYLFNINTNNFWNRKYVLEKNNSENTVAYPHTFRRITELLDSKMKVIDLGCGRGQLIEMIKESRGCDVFGVDISDVAIKAVKERGLNGLALRIPPVSIGSHIFDVAIASEILEHIKNPIALIKEMVRIVKPDGLLIIAVPNNWLYPYGNRDHLWVFNEEKMIRLFKKININQNIIFERIKEQNGEQLLVLVKL